MVESRVGLRSMCVCVQGDLVRTRERWTKMFEMKAQRENLPCKWPRTEACYQEHLMGFGRAKANAPGSARLSWFPGPCLQLAWALVPGTAPGPSS